MQKKEKKNFIASISTQKEQKRRSPLNPSPILSQTG
jgi:hypothetical protein